jgi:hypothetical protein
LEEYVPQPYAAKRTGIGIGDRMSPHTRGRNTFASVSALVPWRENRAFVRLVSAAATLALTLIALVMATLVAQAQPTTFSASPTSGPAPLTVKFCASAGIGIDFGDGMSSGMGIAQSVDCPAGETSYTTHTYMAPGTYQLRGLPCPSQHDIVCGGVAAQASATTITVTPAR